MMSLSSALTAVLLLATPLAGVAQVALNNNTPHDLQPNVRALNIAGATTIVAPPAGFDPIAASDEELAYHGFPPRPNQNTEPKAFAWWAKAMQHSKSRVMPTLQETSIFHGPAKQAKANGVTSAAVANNVSLTNQPSNTSYSYNWSGYVDFSGASSYGST